jgi:hypothetical protein
MSKYLVILFLAAVAVLLSYEPVTATALRQSCSGEKAACSGRTTRCSGVKAKKASCSGVKAEKCSARRVRQTSCTGVESSCSGREFRTPVRTAAANRRERLAVRTTCSGTARSTCSGR